MMLRKVFFVSLAIATALLARATESFACAVCLGGASDSVMEGYNASVFFLMATPYAVVATIVGGLVFTYRRALKRKEKADKEALVLSWKQEDSIR